MPISICWEEMEYSVIRQTLVGSWTLDEYHESIDKIYRWMLSQTQRVHLLVDASQSDDPPQHSYLGTAYAVQFMPPNHGACVVIGARGDIATMYEKAKFMHDIWHRRLYLAQNVPSAHRTITRYEKRTTSSNAPTQAAGHEASINNDPPTDNDNLPKPY